MVYQSQKFDHLLGTSGFSDELLQNHFKLYEGYVKNTNTIVEQLTKSIEKEDSIPSPEYSELKRRFGWEFNGMRLHEYYFGNMKKNGSQLQNSSNLYKKIVENFGSFETWTKDFKITGAMRGIGWAVTTYDYFANRLMNIWINEHDLGHLAGLPVILIMDVFEHAFMIDYGIKKADYTEAFFKAIHWEEVQHRFSHAESLREGSLQKT